MSVADKLNTILMNTERVFLAGELKGEAFGLEVGFTTGYSEGRNECKAKHFSKVMCGDGTDTMLIEDLPFDPDFLSIVSNAPELRLLAKIVSYVEFDFSALGQLAGKLGGTSTTDGKGSYSNGLCTPTTAAKLFSWDGNNATVSGITIGSNPGLCKFGDGVEYLVTAAKYDLKPLKTRIEESVARLPAQSSTKPVYYQKGKVNSVFTAEEWEALIATKPNYTFNLV